MHGTFNVYPILEAIQLNISKWVIRESVANYFAVAAELTAHVQRNVRY